MPKSNVLVIPDLHIPFVHKKALQHCKTVYAQYKCNKVIFIGDIIDNSATTRWDANPDGYSPIDELKLSIKMLKSWYNAFPKATVIVGNHELRILKKLRKGAISNLWLKGFADVLEVPNWDFVNSLTLSGVTYLHGDDCASTLQSLLHSQTSIVFGHFHSKMELIHLNGRFGLCVGWLGDQDAYAFDYAKNAIKKGILGCSVVLNDGTLPIIIPLKS